MVMLTDREEENEEDGIAGGNCQAGDGENQPFRDTSLHVDLQCHDNVIFYLTCF